MKQKRHLAKTLAVIPARGGSKRIPKKNLADFRGRPAIARVVGSALESGVFDNILVSTDDDAIAKSAAESGAEVIWRPKELSDGQTPIQPVVVHAINNFVDAELICLLLATAVMLRPERLTSAYDLLCQDPSLDYVIGIRRFDSSPQRAMSRSSEGLVRMQSPENFYKRSQDLEPLYHDAGQFSFGRRSAWELEQPSFSMRTHGMELPRHEAIDIDEPEDLEFARLVFEASHEQKSFDTM